MKRIPIVVTAYCAGEQAELKVRMAEKLCEELSKTGHYVCLATHSPLPERVQMFCDGYVYDSDNSFQIDGQPTENLSHGLAEMKSIHNALNYLERFGFTEFFKVTYDADPKLPYSTIIERAQYVMETTKKSFICSGWGNSETIAALMFYSTIDFYRKISSLKTPEKWKSCFEVNWYLNAKELGVLDDIHMCHIRLYDDFLGFSIRDYSHQGGTEIDAYPY
jgi:hypothetical protein